MASVGILACLITLHYELEKKRNLFLNQSQLVFENIWKSFDDLEKVNENITSLFNTTKFVSESRFNLFIEPTLDRYPYIENIYYIPRLKTSNLQKIELEKQNDGYTGFHFRIFSKKQFKSSPVKKYIFPISYVQPYNVATSILIGRDILTFKKVQAEVLLSMIRGKRLVFSSGKNSLYAFSSLYIGKEAPKSYNMNIDNVYAILGYKISPSKLLKYIILPRKYKLSIAIRGVNFMPRNPPIVTSLLRISYSRTKTYIFNNQLIDVQTSLSKHLFSYNLTLPISVLLTGFLLTFLSWYILKTNVEFNSFLHQQNRIIESEVNEKTLLLNRQTRKLQIAYEDQLAATNELKSFSYSVSHDLRTPLRAIDGFCGILEDEYAQNLDADGKQYLQRVRNGAQHMSELIDSMLNLAIISNKDINYESVSLSEIANKVILDLKKSNPKRDIDIHIAKNVNVLGDRMLLQSVMENLLQNSWKFTGQTEHPQIEFNQINADNKFSYYVKDNGIGIDMTYADKLFMPFQRLHDKQFEGSGVGLATVQRIIKRHRGTISVSANPNEGAKFTFTLE